jgi:magnesium chelatase subunit D
VQVTAVVALFAVDPQGLGGMVLRSAATQQRDEWLALLKNLLPAGTPQRRIPLNINDTALIGGLDLGATLNAGRPVAQQGVLANADGGVVLLAMAERVPVGTAARLASVLDTQQVAIERDGLTLVRPARLGVVALDEGMADDEQVPSALLDRLAFLVQLSGGAHDDVEPGYEAADIAQARALLPQVQASSQTVEALCAAALALGVYSLRAPLFALKAARCAAALDGVLDVNEDHTALAARLVLAPRATRLPAAPPSDEQPQPDQAPDPASDTGPDLAPENPDAGDQRAQQDQDQQEPLQPPDQLPEDSEQEADEQPDISAAEALAESTMQAAQAAIPAGLLAALKVGQAAKSRAQAAGRSGAAQKSQARGRPLGARRGEPRAGSKLNVIETLRAAAPWQKLRQLQSERQSPTPVDAAHKRIHVRREDFHVTRFKQVGQTTTLFVVDASGSSALNRLAEAKGAVELLLADCYVRRDRVAVLAFRGKSAELLLPPTRSLARAKRALAGLPGGGGTPLATAIDAARELADQISRRGETPIIVLLTDGRANIARDGSPGRAKSAEDAVAAARQLRAAGFTALLLDTSPQAHPAAQALALEMGAAYVPLPYAGAQAVSRVVQMASAAAR